MVRQKKKTLKRLKYSPAALSFILPDKFLLLGNAWMEKVRKAKESGRRWSKGLIGGILEEIFERGIDGVRVKQEELEKTMWAALAGEIKEQKERSKDERLVELIYKTGEENVRRRIGQGS
ncbi:MAG: hypothetical protein FJ044_04615, partial [Candidatus Cloacimonetes bacterium]|nr:hypothetical protein [Candidatus Cloacimonadota bacterium]